MNKFGNGCTFRVNNLGQRIDEDGFVTSSLTYITVRRTCVSVRVGEDKIEVRNTEDPSKKTLSFTPGEWSAFIGGVKKGEFDLK